MKMGGSRKPAWAAAFGCIEIASAEFIGTLWTVGVKENGGLEPSIKSAKIEG